MSRLARRAIAAACLALLAACSTATRIAYNNAAFAAAWTADDWFDLREGQRDWVKERFGRLLAWHREAELPVYERLLHEAAARVATGITEEDARRIYREMRGAYRRAVRRAIPDMADFLLQVSPEQVAYLERRFAESNEKLEREFARGTPRERREARARRYLDRIEDWTGSLSAPQRELVRERVAAIEDYTQPWLEDRRRRQAETLALAKSKPPREAMIAGLERVLVDTDAWRSPAYARQLRARDEQVFAMIAALDRTLAPEQRRRVHTRIAAWASDVAHLMAPPD